MAISLDPLPPSAAPATLLATLRAFTAALETRRSLQAELDSALSSFLTSTPAPLSSGPDALVPAAEPATTGASACASEAVRPPSQDELNEVLRIGFGGLVELKEEVRLLREAIETRWHRADLADVVGRIEEWESERIKATLERDQMRRLQTLQPELEFASSIEEKNALRDSLARQIQEEVQEVHAEIAELSAAEAEAATETEPAPSVPGETQ
ncbi:hypothetical protein Rhopal_002223-T1 [Rhodotorula paludigena]|uniref:Uncharacterized protein n=1 Tax=Rhodotorula paludigena TaxID=86838 RepID=A0AAV5GFD9_9BASI|nr:hypothetical protein Rhopal_002223-T1 [Rhodotorula paludigena]